MHSDIKDKVAMEKWINTMLDKAGVENIVSLSDLADGIKLSRILARARWGNVSVKPVEASNTAKGRLVALENIKKVLAQMEHAGMQVQTIDAMKVRDGDMQHLLALCAVMQRKHEAAEEKEEVVMAPANAQASAATNASVPFVTTHSVDVDSSSLGTGGASQAAIKDSMLNGVIPTTPNRMSNDWMNESLDVEGALDQERRAEEAAAEAARLEAGMQPALADEAAADTELKVVTTDVEVTVENVKDTNEILKDSVTNTREKYPYNYQARCASMCIFIIVAVVVAWKMGLFD